ncbi:hypothetical protein ZWY2020_009116 [Hordeum vulgare]|nr:hypothetical protein ZWY2020_009116 [Hordeum vulgare]
MTPPRGGTLQRQHHHAILFSLWPRRGRAKGKPSSESTPRRPAGRITGSGIARLAEGWCAVGISLRGRR